MDETTRMLGDRYEVGDILGRGGMAEVHLGRDSRLGRTVAIKVLRADMARDPVFHARFRREAQSSAGMNHPSIVAVYDTGEDVSTESGGAPLKLPYIVMEHVAGRTVRDLLIAAGGSGLGTQRAVTITSGVLTALDYSHRHGIIHRDIKPANVMVTPAGDVKVMDFGIARAVADSAATMTQTSAVVGTAQYLSPEQARGHVVDERTDVYSTGCLLYELLTGRPPFLGDSPVSVAYQHVREIPDPPSLHNPAVEEAVDRVVLKSLAKDREDRYASAAEFRDDLLAAEAGYPVSAPAVALAVATQAVPTQTEATRALAAAGYTLAGVPPVRSGLITGQQDRANPFTGSSPAIGLQEALQELTGPGGGPGGPAGGATALDRDPDSQPSGRRRLVLALTGAVLLLALLGVGGWRLVVLSNRVTVPGVTGGTEASATSALSAKGLKVKETEKVDAKAAGTVLSQSPADGTKVAPRSSVTLVVSSGPGTVAVPDVAGKTELQASNLLEAVGLVEGSVSSKDDPGTPSGRMISSDPVAGSKVKPGSVVALVQSSGKVALTSQVGKTSQAAQDALTALGLQPFVTTQTSAKTPGTVIDQSPPAGAVDPGSEVTLVIAAAAPTATATATPTATATSTPTATDTETASPTDTASASESPSATDAAPAASTGAPTPTAGGVRSTSPGGFDVSPGPGG